MVFALRPSTKRQMRVLKIWDAEYPWDVRAEKVCQVLTAHGHEVHLVVRNRDRRDRVEKLPEATVHRLRPWPLLGRRVDAVLQFPAFLNPRWIAHILGTGRAVSPDILLVRDLPLAPLAIQVARWLRVPVVLDMAENYPAMIQAIWDHGRQKWIDWLVRNPRAVAAVERWVVPRVDHTLVVVEESAERLRHLGVEADRITTVLNTPSLERQEARLQSRPFRKASEPLRLAYLGLMELPRGVQVVLDGVKLLKDRGVAVCLDLVGDGRDLHALRDWAAELELMPEDVQFHGYLPYRQALRVVASADIGLVPHIANDSWNSTIPNKLFDYMSMGLPVVTSDAKPAARIVRESGSGAVYRSEDPADLARAIEVCCPLLNVKPRGERAISQCNIDTLDRRRSAASGRTGGDCTNVVQVSRVTGPVGQYRLTTYTVRQLFEGPSGRACVNQESQPAASPVVARRGRTTGTRSCPGCVPLAGNRIRCKGDRSPTRVAIVD